MYHYLPQLLLNCKSMFQIFLDPPRVLKFEDLNNKSLGYENWKYIRYLFCFILFYFLSDELFILIYILETGLTISSGS